MRESLKLLEERRIRVIGVFVRRGHKTGWKGAQLNTILLKDIKDDAGKILTDHLWLNETEGIKALGELKEGDILSFEARVKEYTKGYKGYREDMEWEHPITADYKLSHPTKIKRIMIDLNQKMI